MENYPAFGNNASIDPVYSVAQDPMPGAAVRPGKSSLPLRFSGPSFFGQLAIESPKIRPT